MAWNSPPIPTICFERIVIIIVVVSSFLFYSRRKIIGRIFVRSGFRRLDPRERPERERERERERRRKRSIPGQSPSTFCPQWNACTSERMQAARSTIIEDAYKTRSCCGRVMPNKPVAGSYRVYTSLCSCPVSTPISNRAYQKYTVQTGQPSADETTGECPPPPACHVFIFAPSPHGIARFARNTPPGGEFLA